MFWSKCYNREIQREIQEMQQKMRCLSDFHEWVADTSGGNLGRYIRCAHCYKGLPRDQYAKFVTDEPKT